MSFLRICLFEVVLRGDIYEILFSFLSNYIYIKIKIKNQKTNFPSCIQTNYTLNPRLNRVWIKLAKAPN